MSASHSTTLPQDALLGAFETDGGGLRYTTPPLTRNGLLRRVQCEVKTAVAARLHGSPFSPPPNNAGCLRADGREVHTWLRRQQQ